MKKLNSHGFAHHLLLPIIVVVAVVAIGGYVYVRQSSAQTMPGGVVGTFKLTCQFQGSAASVNAGYYKSNGAYAGEYLMSNLNAKLYRDGTVVQTNNFSGRVNSGSVGYSAQTLKKGYSYKTVFTYSTGSCTTNVRKI